MRESYRSYAPIYARSGQTAWSEHLARWTLALLAQPGVEPGTLIDWGCGDGAAGAVFAAAGWRVVGVDSSPAMLDLARARALPGAYWMEADLRDATLETQAKLATALGGTLNYLVSAAELEAAWRTIAASLQPGGYVVADVTTPYEYAVSWNGRYSVTADTDDVLVVNRRHYSATHGIARDTISWFARDERGRWRRGKEVHLQRAHTEEELAAAIEGAGLVLQERCTPDGSAVNPLARRVIYVARRMRDKVTLSQNNNGHPMHPVTPSPRHLVMHARIKKEWHSNNHNSREHCSAWPRATR